MQQAERFLERQRYAALPQSVSRHPVLQPDLGCCVRDGGYTARAALVERMSTAGGAAPEPACRADGLAACVTTSNVQYSAQPGGDYEKITTVEYKHVGAGLGSYKKEAIQTHRCPWCLCSVCICFLLATLAACYWLLYDFPTATTTPCEGCYTRRTYRDDSSFTSSKEIVDIPTFTDVVTAIPAPIIFPAASTTTTTETFGELFQVPRDPATCTLRADPHITTFDGALVDYYTPGEYWIVKSNWIWIQGRYLATPYTHGKGCVKAIAVGGPFLQNSNGEAHKLIIGTEDAWWEVPDRQETTKILTSYPDEFRNVDPPVHLTYSNPTQDVMTGDEGWCKKVVQALLPDDITLHIERWIDGKNASEQYLNMYIRMRPAVGQDGHCGNFNGVAVDDTSTARAASRRVPRQHLIFDYRTVSQTETANGHSLIGEDA